MTTASQAKHLGVLGAFIAHRPGSDGIALARAFAASNPGDVLDAGRQLMEEVERAHRTIDKRGSQTCVCRVCVLVQDMRRRAEGWR